MKITIQPISINWSEWTTRYRALSLPTVTVTGKEILEAVSKWQSDTNKWLMEMPNNQQDDLMDLAMAEIDMLYCLVDPAAHVPSGWFPNEPTEDDRLDFRTRFYELQPLINTAVMCGLIKSYAVEEQMRQLERFATERRGWLP